MNVLVFVSVMLLLLASISYNELQVFYSQALSHAGWIRYMDTIEGCLFNTRMQDLYKLERKSKEEAPSETDSVGHQLEKGEAKEKPPAQQTKSKGSARINFRVLLGKVKNMDPEKEKQFNELIKNLLREVYGGTNFYQNYLKERPNFIDELLLALKKDSADMHIKRAKQLETLELKDEQLNDILYLMLRNMPNEGGEKKECDTISLLDFLSDSPRTQIRVFLAPRAILLAAFKDPQIVSQIIEKREELYKKVDRDEYSTDTATQEFQGTFDSYALFHDILDFTVTKTNPANYL